MAERRHLGDAFRSGVAVIAATAYADLTKYREHRTLKTQREIVARFRTAVRLYIARCYREEMRGRPDRAVRLAARAGQWFGEYRIHYRQLRTIRGFRPDSIYGAPAARSAALSRNAQR